MTLPRKLLVLLVGLAGCRDAEIRQYVVPKPEVPRQTVLGAIVPHGGRVWYFKASGPADAVAEHKTAFRDWLSTVRFQDRFDRPVVWTKPDQWTQLPGDGLRYATLEIAPGLEATVTSLGPESAAVLPNVNRWRGQINLKPITDNDLSRLCSDVTVGGVAATFVELHSPEAAPARPLTFTVPGGWVEIPASGMRVAALKTGTGDAALELTVIRLAGDAGGLLANVNRWRKEVELPELDAEKLRETTRVESVGGTSGAVVDLLGPETAGAKRQRTLGAIVVRHGQSWFFKLRGPAAAVESHRSAFDEFLRSVRWSEGQP